MNQKIRIARTFLFLFAGRLLPAYLAVSLLFYFFLGPIYAKKLLPFIPFPIKLIYPEYQIESVRFVPEKMLIECKMTVQGDFLNEQGASQRAEIQMKTGIPVSALYIAPILLFFFASTGLAGCQKKGLVNSNDYWPSFFILN